MDEKVQAKQAWESPALIPLGDLETLTAAGAITTPDGGLGGS